MTTATRVDRMQVDDLSVADISNNNIETKPELSSQSSGNAFIDKLTLELLMNRNHYNRYISQTNPQKFREHQEHLQNLEKYRDSILEITESLLADPDRQITTEVNNEFDVYVKTLIRYFHMKELENNCNNNNGSSKYVSTEEDSEDTLFGESGSRARQPPTHSYWGKECVVKNYDR
jgi:hypothetical protein